MKFSEFFGLNKSQSELDFVDIDVEDDIPLYIDPVAFTVREDDWSVECNDLVNDFFDTILNRIRGGENAVAESLMAGLAEPSETHLGVSEAGVKGRGIGIGQARQLMRAIRRSSAFETGNFSELVDFELFVDNIGPDKISDLTTNIIRGKLIDYTISQCRLHGVPTKNVAAGYVWNINSKRWDGKYANLPVVDDGFVLLVPKHCVRRTAGMDCKKLYNQGVVNFLVQQHLDKSSSLVEILKSGKKKVYKNKVKAENPFSKDLVSTITSNNPEVLVQFKEKQRLMRTRVPDISEDDLNRKAVAELLSDRLKETPLGHAGASDYHNLVVGILEVIFFPDLVYPEKEREINDGRKRVDILYTNGMDSSFFSMIMSHNLCNASKIFVECKNYTKDPSNPEVDQIVGRFDLNRGRFGLLIFRSCEDYDLILDRCGDVVRQGNGVVVPIDDNFLHESLANISSGFHGKVSSRLRGLFDRVVDKAMK